MKFLFVIHYPVFGGPHNQALQLDGELNRRGWQTLVLLPDEPGNAAVRLRAGGLDVIEMRLHRLRARLNPWIHMRVGLGLPGDVKRIRRLIRRSGVDLVVIGGLVNPQAAIAAKFEGIPIVWELLDTRAPMLARRLMMALVTRLSDAILSTGHRTASEHPMALAQGDRLISFFPPVDVGRFKPDGGARAAARRELGLSEGDLVVGNVGNLNPQKGHPTFLSAAAQIHQQNPSIRFVILGATSPQHKQHTRYTAGLWQSAEKYGLRLNRELIVRDPGSRVAELASALDIFWLTSEPRSEGIPTVVEEAMALALPVVAVNVGGVGDVITHGTTGFLVPTHRPDLIAKATFPLLFDERLRKRIGDNARRWAVNHCDVEVCADKHLRAFEIAMAHHKLAKSESRATAYR